MRALYSPPPSPCRRRFLSPHIYNLCIGSSIVYADLANVLLNTSDGLGEDQTATLQIQGWLLLIDSICQQCSRPFPVPIHLSLFLKLRSFLPVLWSNQSETISKLPRLTACRHHYYRFPFFTFLCLSNMRAGLIQPLNLFTSFTSLHCSYTRLNNPHVHESEAQQISLPFVFINAWCHLGTYLNHPIAKTSTSQQHHQ